MHLRSISLVADALTQAESSTRSISFLSDLSPIQIPLLPTNFSDTLLGLRSLPKLRSFVRLAVFSQDQNTFRLSKMFWNRHASFQVIEGQCPWPFRRQFLRINYTSTHNTI